MGRIGFCIVVGYVVRLFIYEGREITNIYIDKNKAVGVLFLIGNN